MKAKILFSVAAVAAVATGCQTLGLGSSSSSSSPAPAPAAATPAPAPAPAAKAATPAPAPAGAPKSTEEGLPPPKLVKSRDGSFEGELYGTLSPSHKFSKLQFGMGQKEVMDTVGPPTDQKTYVTGKAWIPFYFGGDRWRHEMFYKGDGRLVFAGGSGYGQVGYLLKIIVDPKESGYAR
jgi:hypothetical protein